MKKNLKKIIMDKELDQLATEKANEYAGGNKYTPG